MGREVTAVCRWKGEVAEAKILLESTELVVRGALKARIPRGSISAIDLVASGLRVTAGTDVLQIELSREVAEHWRAALEKPVPTLAAKLGISAASPAFVIGAVADDALTDALRGARTTRVGDAAVLIAVIASAASLQAAWTVASQAPNRHIWCVSGKGKYATVADAEIRAFMRERGYVDTKTSAVSEQLTATRYGRRG
jgi:hypothetical protein